MVRFFLALLLWSVALFGLEEDMNTTTQEGQETAPVVQKVLYLSYVDVPKRVIKGELFSITIKTFSVVQDFDNIEYSFSGEKGVEILNDGIPKSEIEGHAYLDTFYFKATSANIRLPDITATLNDASGNIYPQATLKAVPIEAIALNPRKDFCNIVAKTFAIKHYKTTSYDATHNIVVFSATAIQTFLKDFHLNGVASQGFESLDDTIESSKMIYYAVIDKKQENLPFSYFNTIKNDYIKLNIPIIVEEDSVVTQSDLKPKDNSKKQIKLFIALSVILFGVVMLLWRQRYFYIVFIAFPAIYVVFLLMPEKKVCVKEDSKIRILPLENGTVFEVTTSRMKLEKIGKTKGFVKVELPNKKIGWVKDEDTCSY